MTEPEADGLRKSQADSPGSAPSEDWTADPRLDLFAQGPLRELVLRFRDRLIETACRIAGDLPANANHLQQAYEALLSKDSNADWPVRNRRRVYLIHKEASGDISSSELAELEQLQAEADRHMREVAPRPLEAPWDLREGLLRRAADADDGDRQG